MKTYQLAIAHRVCPKLAGNAVAYTDKYEMVRATAASLFSAIAGLRVKLFVLLDGCDDRYRTLFSSSDPLIDVEIIETPAIGNGATFGKQIELLDAAKECSDFLYFSEDDYLYAPSAFRDMMKMLELPEVDFVTPLDHPDRYCDKLFETRTVPLIVAAGRHWRSCSTTCLTFMSRSAGFSRYASAFRTYANGNLDCTMWLAVTQDGLFSFPRLVLNLLRFLTKRGDFNHVLQLAAWKWSWRYILTHRAARLWSPLPSLGFHLCAASLAPGQTPDDYLRAFKR